MKAGNDKRMSWLAVFWSVCILTASGLSIILAISYHESRSTGGFLLRSEYFFEAMFTMITISLLIITISLRRYKGLIFATLAIIVIALILYNDFGVRGVIERRNESKKKVTLDWPIINLLTEELLGYAKDNDGNLPAAERWCDALIDHNPELTKDNFRRLKMNRIR